jgi:tetratricopeptide (TPR) repeat protein
MEPLRGLRPRSQFRLSNFSDLDYAQTCNNLGNLLRERGNRAEALAWYDRAIDAGEAYFHGEDARAHPWIMQLRNSYWGRAEALDLLGRHEEAKADWKRTFELTPAESRPLFAIRRSQARGGIESRPIEIANTLARNGDAAGAIERIGPLLARDDLSAATRFTVACVLSLCANAVAQDEEHAVDERARLAGDYASRAIDQLRRASSDGLFKDPQVRSLLERQEDLAPIRQLAGFRAIQLDLAFPTDVFVRDR